ncbi:MAG: CoA transferase, partial [Aestuariivirgaceae bacterium]
LEAEDVPCAPVLTRLEMRDHPQIAANGIIIELDHDHAGRLRQARPPAEFSVTEPQMRMGAPAYGAHTHEVLSECGFSSKEITELESAGAIIRADRQEAAQ